VLAQLRPAPPVARHLAAAALAALIAAGAWRSAARQRVWHDNPTLFRQTVLDAPMSYKAHWAWGMTLFDAKKFGSAEAELRRAVELYPFDSDLLTDFGNQYREWHICPPAIPLYEQALAVAPDRPDSRAGLIACLLEQARFQEAKSQARIGIARGFSVPVFRKLYGIADSVIVARRLGPRPRASE
jgi:Flp pilus assembly protein TadD